MLLTFSDYLGFLFVLDFYSVRFISPLIAIVPLLTFLYQANEQHYEVPDEFYYAVLGPYLKYSSGFWKDENTTLAESEIYMLDMYIERAGKMLIHMIVSRSF